MRKKTILSKRSMSKSNHKLQKKEKYEKIGNVNLKSFVLGGAVATVLLAPTSYVFSKELMKKTIDVYYDDIEVIVNAEEIPLRNELGEKVEPFLYQGTTYVPLRAISENFGKVVWWDQEEKRVIIFDETAQESGDNVDISNLPIPAYKKELLTLKMSEIRLHEILGLPQCVRKYEEYREDIYYFEDGKFLVVKIANGVAQEFLWQDKLKPAEQEKETFVIKEVIAGSESDFDDDNILEQMADMVVICNVNEIQKMSNYNDVIDEYEETHTYINVKIVEDLTQGSKQISSGENLENQESIDVVLYGGTISYDEYEKALEEQEREELDRLRGFIEKPEKKKDTVVVSKIKYQTEVIQGSTYLMYLKYSKDYDCYVPVSEVYGVREYRLEDGMVKNPKTNVWEYYGIEERKCNI